MDMSMQRKASYATTVVCEAETSMMRRFDERRNRRWSLDARRFSLTAALDAGATEDTMLALMSSTQSTTHVRVPLTLTNGCANTQSIDRRRRGSTWIIPQ
ncbi:hypothetical protein PINS_up013826 [Pythium insidiosum]|nr:hypothetical protein PINS_up013826 [Pythium insidiosum]